LNDLGGGKGQKGLAARPHADRQSASKNHPNPTKPNNSEVVEAILEGHVRGGGGDFERGKPSRKRKGGATPPRSECLGNLEEW